MSDPDQPFPPREWPDNPHQPGDYPQYPTGYPPPVPYPPPQPYPGGPPPYPGGPPPYPGAPVGYPGGQPGYPGAPAGWPAGDPYGPAPAYGTNGLAIGSLVCSLVGLLCGISAIGGVVLGVIAMQQTKKTGQEGYGLALAGVITGAVMLVLWLGWLLLLALH